MKNRIILLFGLMISMTGYSQDSSLVRDVETWTTIGVEKKVLGKKVTLSLDQAFRFDDNSSSLDQFYTDLGANYKISKGFKVGFGYRILQSGSIKNGFDKQHRLNLDMMYKQKLDRLVLAYRLRYTNKNVRGITVANGDFNKHKFRLRVKAAYNIKNWKLDPYVSGELFYSKGYETVNFIEEITEGYAVSAFQKYRITIGTKYKTGKVGTLGMFYRIERQFASYPFAYNATTWNIFGLNYTFKLK